MTVEYVATGHTGHAYGEACIKTRREFILIEKDPKYVAMAERRIKQVQPPLPLTMEARI
jgi:DNA modification methylase